MDRKIRPREINPPTLRLQCWTWFTSQAYRHLPMSAIPTPLPHPHPNFNVEFHIHLKHTMDQWVTYIWHGAESYRRDLNIDLWGVRREVEGKGYMSTLILGNVTTLRSHKSIWFYCPCTVPLACSTLCKISLMTHDSWPRILVFYNPISSQSSQQHNCYPKPNARRKRRFSISRNRGQTANAVQSSPVNSLMCNAPDANAAIRQL